MKATQDNALTAGAEVVAEDAKRVGMKCRLNEGVAAVTVLERALAIAWCDIAMWKGANDTEERFNEAINQMVHRIRGEMLAQRVLRRGHRG